MPIYIENVSPGNIAIPRGIAYTLLLSATQYVFPLLHSLPATLARWEIREVDNLEYFNQLLLGPPRLFELCIGVGIDDPGRCVRPCVFKGAMPGFLGLLWLDSLIQQATSHHVCSLWNKKDTRKTTVWSNHLAILHSPQASQYSRDCRLAYTILEGSQYFHTTK